MTDLYNFQGAWPCNLGLPPSGDPKILAFNALLFPTAGASIILDFRDDVAKGRIDTIQSVYVDNNSAATLTLQLMTTTAYRMIMRPKTQGWYPLAMDDETQLRLTSSAAVNDATQINLLFGNVLMVAGPWATT